MKRHHPTFVSIAVLFAVLTAGRANAQFLESFDEPLWGVQGSFTPSWTFVDQFSNLFSDISHLDIAGSEYSIGFARGRMAGGHWGLSLVRQRIDTGRVCLSNEPDCADLGDVQLQGFEFGSFLAIGEPFAGDRIQIGMHIGVGGGWYRGTVSQGDRNREVSELLTFAGVESIPIPIFRAEFAVAGTVAPGLKVIGSTGYGFPARRTLTISAAWFPLGGR